MQESSYETLDRAQTSLHQLAGRVPRAVLVGLATAGMLLASATAQAHVQGYAFVHADQPTQVVYSPDSTSRAYNDGGGDISIQRFGVGTYQVTFDDFEDVGTVAGHVQMTATDPGSRYCNSSSWQAPSVNVLCFDLNGNPADARFNVVFLKPGPDVSDYAYAWVDNVTSASSTPSFSWLYSPGAGGSATVTRHRVGHYSIRWDGLDAIGDGPRADLVTAWGGNARCQIDGLISDGFNVRCHTPLGLATDSRFNALSMRTKDDDDGWGFARVSSPLSLGYTIFGDSGFNAGLADQPIVDHPATGVYDLTWPGLDMVGINLGSVQVSAEAFYDRFCGVDPEDGDSVRVRCFDSAGTPRDTQFHAVFLKPPKKAWLRDFSFAHANDNISGPFPYQPSSTQARNLVSPGNININRVSTGVYHVEFVGTDEFAPLGHVQVSVTGVNSNHCNVETSYGEWAEIRCFSRLGAFANTNFNVLQLKPSTAGDSIAYARADSNFLSSYTADPAYSWNPGGSPVTVTRTATGVFSVQFPGFAGFGDDGGNAQVSVFGLSNGSCQIASWGPETANVRCFSTTGNPSNISFNVLLVHADENDQSLAYVYSGTPTSSMYTPPATWAFQSGKGPITAVHNSTGSYTIQFDEFSQEGLGSGNVFVTTHGSTDGTCNGYSWGGDYVYIACFDNGGSFADRRFSLLYLKDFTNRQLDPDFVNVPEPGFGIGVVAGLLGVFAIRRRRSEA